MHIAVVANGDLPAQGHDLVVTLLETADLVIAADGGLVHCVELGIWPDTLVGDLDSAPAALVDQARAQGVTVVEYPADKDATDLELALAEAEAAGATSITAVAPFGGRLDHELATIGLLAAEQWRHIAMAATDGRRQMWIVRSQLDLTLPIESTLSLVPWHGDVPGVTTSGLQWPLNNERLVVGTTRGVSNVASQPAQTVAVAAGTLLVIADLCS